MRISVPGLIIRDPRRKESSSRLRGYSLSSLSSQEVAIIENQLMLSSFSGDVRTATLEELRGLFAGCSGAPLGDETFLGSMEQGGNAIYKIQYSIILIIFNTCILFSDFSFLQVTG